MSVDSNGFTLPSIPTLFKYEPFLYSVVFPLGYVAYGDLSLNYINGTLRNNSVLLNSVSVVSSNRVDLSSTGVTFTTAAAGEQFLVQARNASSDILASTPITVKVGNGRFTVPQGSNYTLFANESANVPLNTVAAMTSVNSTPALPVGLFFTKLDVAGNSWAITGQAVTTYQESSYLVIGNNTSNGFVVTTTLLLRVNPTRMILSGVPALVPGLTVGTAISPITITAGGANSVAPGNITYQVPGLPSGLFATDISGTQLQPGANFQPTDASMTMILAGTPTSATAIASIPSGSVTSRIFASSGSLFTSNLIQFTYGEAVLFTNPLSNAVLSGLFYGLATSNTTFQAATYFGSTPIYSIYSPNLRSDLSLNFSYATQSGTLVGTPTLTDLDTTPFTFTALNANQVEGNVVVTIPIATDAVTITRSTTDVCYNFILGRPVSNSLTGYYASNISYTAVSASGRALTFSSNNFPAGITSSVSGNVLSVRGTPTKTASLATLNVTAGNGSLSLTDSNLSVAVLSDQFTWTYDPSSNSYPLLQNRAISTIQATARALSGLSILSYFSTNLPPGLKITDTGLISGTPTGSGSVTSSLYASTGYSSLSNSISFTVDVDSALFAFPPIVVSAGSVVPATQVTAVSYSQTSGSNFVLSSNPYGITLTSNGVLGGTLISGIPPGTTFPPSTNLTLSAVIGAATQSTSLTLAASNSGKFRTRTFGIASSGIQAGLYYYESTVPPASPPSFERLTSGSPTPTDFQYNGTQFLMATNGASIFSSFDGQTFTSNVISVSVTSVAYLATEGLWYGAGLSGGQYTISTSSNGTTWTALTSLGASSTPPVIRAANGNVLANFNGVSVYPNPVSGVGWFNSLQGKTIIDLADDSNATPTWVATASDGTVWVSQVNGNSWTQSTTVAGATSGQQSFYGDQWYNIYLESTLFKIQVSQDGFVWTAFAWPPPDVDNLPGDAPNYEPPPSLTAYYDGTFLNVLMNDAPAIYTYLPSTQSWAGYEIGNLVSVVYPPRVIQIGNDPIVLTLSVTNTFTTITTSVTGNGATAVYFVPDTSGIRVGSTVVVTGSFVPTYVSAYYTGTFTVTAVTTNTSFTTVNTNTATTADFTNGTVTASGTPPIFTSPTGVNYSTYQYVPITPIYIATTNPNTDRIYVEVSKLPLGLSFNTSTSLITGSMMNIGPFTVTIYAGNANGTSTLTLYFNSQIPLVLNKNQDYASAYTSFLRQGVVANAAIGGRDNTVYPSLVTTGGSFMTGIPPNVVTPAPPCCEIKIS